MKNTTRLFSLLVLCLALGACAYPFGHADKQDHETHRAHGM